MRRPHLLRAAVLAATAGGCGIDDSGTVLLRVVAKGDLTECESYMLEWGDD